LEGTYNDHLVQLQWGGMGQSIKTKELQEETEWSCPRSWWLICPSSYEIRNCQLTFWKRR